MAVMNMDSSVISVKVKKMEKVFNKVVKCGKMWGFYNIFTPIKL